VDAGNIVNACATAAPVSPLVRWRIVN